MVNTNSRPRLPVLGVFLSVCLIAQGTGSDGHNALGISPSGHYVTYKGEVLMLIGDSCLADPGCEYVVYSMIGSPATVSVNLSATTGKTIDCRFYNPADGQSEPVFRRTGGGSHESFVKPDERDWVLHIAAK